MILQDRYKKEVVPAMMEKFGYKSPMAVPRIRKVSVNTGIGRLMVNAAGEEARKIQDVVTSDLALICGQKPVLTRARQAISSFKIRKGMVVGASVTLRRKKMYDFLERLIHIVLPRSRDFRGIPISAFDKSGNVTLGIKEHTTFPEISPEKTRHSLGLEITVVTNARTREEAVELLKLMGFPIGM